MKSLSLTILSVLFSFALLSQSAVISGKVLDKSNNEPIGFAPVAIQGTTQGAVTNDLGEFSINGLNPGLYNLEVVYTGYLKGILFEVEVTNDRPASVTIYLEPVVLQSAGVEIIGTTLSNREESPISVRTIGTNEIKRNPGGNRDISRAIRSLPGVAAVPSFRNDIIIRGGAANENRFYIDGIEIPNINHFATQGASGGPVGLINVDLINEVEFYSGAFPAARGNALSSVLEFGFKDPRADKTTVNFVVGSSDLGVTVEGPTGKKSGLVFSARRSYLQGLFTVLGLPFLPTYNDFNAKWKVNLNDKNKLTFIALGAYDQFELNLKLNNDSTSEDFQTNTYLLRSLAINEQWNYTVGTKFDHYTENGRLSVIASRNVLQNDAFKYENNDESLPKTLDYTSRETENKLRVENKWFGKNGWKALYGVNYEFAQYTNASAVPVYFVQLDSVVTSRYNSALDLNKYGLFIQGSKTLLQQRLVLSGGVRMDGNAYNDEMKNPLNQLSPRFSLRYSFAPKWSINFNTGIYYQLPTYTALGFRSSGMLINKDARYIRNDQIVTGIEYDWAERNSIITVEGFYKKYSNYPLSINRGISLANLGADFGVIGDEPLNYAGLGRAYGLEFLFQQKFFQGFYGILAYTFVRSEFTNVSGSYAPSSWDSRHLVSLTGGKKFKRNWEVGGRFQLSGGLPYTPDDEAASMNIDSWNRLGAAVTDWSQLNAKRIKTFHQLDVRVDKKWFFTKWSLDLFLDIQNIYNHITVTKPILDVKRDGLGNPIVDPNNPNSYQPLYLENTNGTVLPSIGVIIEL